MELYISEEDIVNFKFDDKNLEDYYFSKLCFLDTNFEKCKKRIVINEGNDLHYDNMIDEYYLPHNIDEFQRCFLYRVIIDSIQVKCGNLPLHAAAISNDNNTIIITSDSGKGKSYISDSVCNLVPDCNIIGDDHIIISQCNIQGNLKRRLRNIYDGSCKYMDNVGIDKLHNLVFVCFELSDTTNEIVDLSILEALKYFFDVSAFKYLNEVFTNNNVSYKMKEFSGVNDMYERVFCKFIKNSTVLRICGTHSFAIDCISKIIR